MIRTREEIIQHYADDREHVSPIIQEYLNTSPRRDFTEEHKPSEAVQKYLDSEKEKINPILKDYM